MILRTCKDVEIGPHERVMISTGVRLSLPADHAAFIFLAPWLSKGNGLLLPNSLGLIDSGYRGEIKVPVCMACSGSPITIKQGEPVAIAVVMHCPQQAINNKADKSAFLGLDDRVDKLEELKTSTGIKITMLDESLPLPSYANLGDNGLDIRISHDLTIMPLSCAEARFAIKVEVPQGCIGLLQPRSGLAAKQGLSILASPVPIFPEDKNKELSCTFVNLDPNNPIVLSTGDRAAQLVIVSALQVVLKQVESLDETTRGSGGFGSTGST